MLRLYRQQILPGLSFECAVPEGEGYGPGGLVVLQCERFLETGRLQAPCPCPPAEDIAVWERQRSERGARRMEGAKIPLVIRKATEEDRRKREENRALAQSMTPLVEEKLRECRLDHLHLTTLHLTLDQKCLVCLYTAEGRVDFRSFLHSMAAAVPQRLEMRQIGPREEAAILGGLGICGRPVCCHGFLSLMLPPAQGAGPWRSSSKLGLCNQPRCCLHFSSGEPKELLRSPQMPENKTP
ncbi:MAG: regulatory iron-sulfur-containing complex subunit RicT [Oligosphaeraceae bacterium]